MNPNKNQDETGIVPAGQAQAQGQQDQPGTAIEEYGTSILDAVPGAREAFLAMLRDVPEPGDDAMAQIAAQIMGAESLEDLDRPWDSEGMRDYDGQVLRVHAIRQLPSSYTKGLGVYLVCECDQPHIGEKFVLTTGSVSIVVQLVVANARGWLPLEVVPRQADERPGREGRPMHLEVVRRRGRQRAAVIDQSEVPTRQQQQRTERSKRILDEARAAGRPADQ